MTGKDFPGKTELIARLRDSVAHPSTRVITDRVRQTLSAMIAEQKIELPEVCWESNQDGYARRLLHHQPNEFSLMAMTWGPHQGTHIHDHSGMWCVEGVVSGNIEVVQYEMLEQQNGRCRFERVGTMLTGPGSAGSLIPPHEYHTIFNPDDNQVALTIHVYSGEMTECNVFSPIGDGWYRREQRRLSCD